MSNETCNNAQSVFYVTQKFLRWVFSCNEYRTGPQVLDNNGTNTYSLNILAHAL